MKCSSQFRNYFCLLLALMFACMDAASDKKAHGHTGVLEPYDGKHISYSISKEEAKLLEDGKPVVKNERTGKAGKGFVIQDIDAPAKICMERITDLVNYHKFVPKVKKVSLYDEQKYPNGTETTGAKFDVGVLGMSFTYFLQLKYEPKYSTYDWTLDYKFSSDFDDNVGHWQVMDHPTKKGWTRVLYSCQIKLYSWIPEFVVTTLTKSALVESTTWVKIQSEEASKNLDEKKKLELTNPKNKAQGYTPCYYDEEGMIKYIAVYGKSACPKSFKEL